MTADTAALLAPIEASRAAFAQLVAGLSPAIAREPIGEGRWSPGEYLEHLVRAEEVTVWRMWQAVEEARAGAEPLPSPTPKSSIEEVVARTWREREESPPLAVPRLRGPVGYWLARLDRNAALTAAFAARLRADELDSLAYPHPISGPFTLRQGLEFIRYHLDRHRGQLLEAGLG